MGQRIARCAVAIFASFACGGVGRAKPVASARGDLSAALGLVGDSVIQIQATKDAYAPVIVLIRTGSLQADSAAYRAKLERQMLTAGWARSATWKDRSQDPLLVVPCFRDACDEQADLPTAAAARGYLFERIAK